MAERESAPTAMMGRRTSMKNMVREIFMLPPSGDFSGLRVGAVPPVVVPSFVRLPGISVPGDLMPPLRGWSR